MCPKPLRAQFGISLIVVLILLAVVAGMALSMVSLSVNQHYTGLYSAFNVQGHFAAKAGLSYAAARINTGQDCSGIDSSLSLSSYEVSLACVQHGPFNEGDTVSFHLYTITSLASRGSIQLPDPNTRVFTTVVRYPAP